MYSLFFLLLDFVDLGLKINIIYKVIQKKVKKIYE